MSSTTRWTPKWKTVKIKLNDKDIDICFDEITKLYACPICAPECKKGNTPNYGAYFFSLDDLKEHILSHNFSYWLKKRKTEEEEEEEEKVKAEEEEE
ncbi:hypothetical protein SUSAZ_03340 [Sulfolobus acidocaldarius SUSAZ]|nr:hypothetical protein SUSAZ_03340 [Sulfolobus acidocaldarius SUSAZ]